MKHFDAQDWIDFARQAADRRSTSEMQRHLDEGCVKCLKNMEIWRRVVMVAKRESRYEVPESSTRAVRASFALRKVTPFPARKLELATLVFDSSQQPVAAGVRSGSHSPRQLLYKSGSVCIDVHVQPKLGSGSVVLIGQLLDSSKPVRGIGDVLVSLLSEGKAVSRNKTNDLGEFDFRFGSLRHLQLVFGMGESRALVVPIPGAEIETQPSVV